MKGWILLENGRKVITSDNSVEVFLTKKDLLECYNGALGEANTIQRVRLEVKNEL